MPKELLIACVGKPSAGKSSFLNAVTDAQAKVGNYPFTTIEPNTGVSFYRVDCACKRFGKESVCGPRYGRCENGTRYIPVKVLDVAGLVPGASEGEGLGNKFLDDLRHADVLMHIVDVSGTTTQKGEETIGYDPSNDVDWLDGEICAWIYNNLDKRWGSIVRRHTSANNSDEALTLVQQLSGYGATEKDCQATLDKAKMGKPLKDWEKEDVAKFVKVFVAHKFPTVIVLNKIDLEGADKNIEKMFARYDNDRIVLTSALAEAYLRKLRKQGYVKYLEGDPDFATKDELTEDDLDYKDLKPIDDKNRKRLDRIRDLILFRYSGTGCYDAIVRAVDIKGWIPVYIVRSIANFGANDKSGLVFRDCMLVPPGTTVRRLAGMLSEDLEKNYVSCIGADGKDLAEDATITPNVCDIVCYKTGTQTGDALD
eukprot:Clim_evm8s84 gene=Clim_evmTU8s84